MFDFYLISSFLTLSHFQVSYQPLLTVHGCIFEDVASYHEGGTVFYDVSHTSIASITSTTIHDSDGYFYYSSHYMPSSITIENVVVSTSKISAAHNTSWDSTEVEHGLFDFGSVDEVSITDLTVNYSYDMTNCQYLYEIENHDIEGTANYYECTNPVIFIKNNGVKSTSFFD